MNSYLNLLKNKKELIGICIFVFSICFDPDWSSKALIFLVVISFFSLDIKSKLINKKYLIILLLTIAFILVNDLILLKSILWSSFTTTGLCILFYLLLFQTKYKFLVLKTTTIFFTAGVFTVGIINLFVFFNESKNNVIFDAWAYYSIIDIHKIYFGAFLNLTFLMLFNLYVKKEINIKPISILTPIIILLLIYTGSVSNILIFVLIALLCFSYKFTFRFYKSIYLLLLAGPIIILLLISTSYGKGLLYKIEGEGSRVRNFEVGKSIIIKSPLYGYGIGNELNALRNARNKKSWEYQNKYNAHNQYFEYLIGGGVFYLLLSLFPIVFINIKNNKINYNLLANGFTLILSYIFIIESFQQRHHGQIFYSFFVSLIIFEMYKEKLR